MNLLEVIQFFEWERQKSKLDKTVSTKSFHEASPNESSAQNEKPENAIVVI
jgi:hypothetical protein